jgi:hypothetical protein
MSVAEENPYMWTVEDGQFVSDPDKIDMWNAIMEGAHFTGRVQSLAFLVGIYLIESGRMGPRGASTGLPLDPDFQELVMYNALCLLSAISKRAKPPQTRLMSDFARFVSENGWNDLLTKEVTSPA